MILRPHFPPARLLFVGTSSYSCMWIVVHSLWNSLEKYKGTQPLSSGSCPALHFRHTVVLLPSDRWGWKKHLRQITTSSHTVGGFCYQLPPLLHIIRKGWAQCDMARVLINKDTSVAAKKSNLLVIVAMGTGEQKHHFPAAHLGSFSVASLMKGLQVGQSTRHGKECCSPASTDRRFTQAELVLQ